VYFCINIEFFIKRDEGGTINEEVQKLFRLRNSFLSRTYRDTLTIIEPIYGEDCVPTSVTGTLYTEGYLVVGIV